MNNKISQNLLKWDLRFLELARSVSTWSKDPSTKCGAIAVKHHKVIGTGYNGFPRNIADDERLFDREKKLELILHAEDNLFLSYGGDMSFGYIYTWPIPPSHKCIIKIIQKGFVRVIAPKPYGGVAERFKESFIRSAISLV